jgi:hypothetical protein
VAHQTQLWPPAALCGVGHPGLLALSCSQAQSVFQTSHEEVRLGKDGEWVMELKSAK